MKIQIVISAISLLLVGIVSATPAFGQYAEVAKIREATQVLNEIQSVPLSGIPDGELQHCSAVVIVPNVIKIGFVASGRHGKGIAMVRTEDGTWGNPIFVSLTGGGFGWQAGIQSTDVIMLFKSRETVESMLTGRFTIGADASVAAGPVGRQASAATDAQLKAEILSYSRSRGLFAGVALDGSALTIDNAANTAFYGANAALLPNSLIRQKDLPVPQEVRTLQTALGNPAPAPVPGGAIVTPHPVPTVLPTPAAPQAIEVVRRELDASSRSLNVLVDANWQQYLAMPSEVYQPGLLPSIVSIQGSLDHFNTVQYDPKYQALQVLPEFKRTHDLLRQYLFLLRHSQSTEPATSTLPQQQPVQPSIR